MPGVETTVGEQLAALARAAGPEAAALITAAPDPAIEAIISTWPRAFATDRAHALGFTAESTVDELIAAVATATGHRHRPVLRVTGQRVEFVAKLLRLKMTPWDFYNARNTDQSYPSAVKPSDFGLPMEMPDIHAGLRAVGFAKT